MILSIVTGLKLVVKFLDNHNGTLIFLATIILVGVTWYYAVQAKKQVNESHEMVIQSKHREEAEAQQAINITLNYVFLLNSEIQMNLLNLVMFQFYAKWNTKELSNLKSLSTNSQYLSDSIWKLINVEAAKCFSKELMEELVGYYNGIQYMLKMINANSHANTINWINPTKTQLLSYLLCTRLLEKEIGRELRKQQTYEIDGKVVKIDSKTGDVVLV